MSYYDVPLIRRPKRSDVPTILTMLRELAAHVNSADAVVATEADIASAFVFDDEPSTNTMSSSNNNSSSSSSSDLIRPAHCLLLFTPAGRPVGLATYSITYNAWRGTPGIYLDDLYVREGERGKRYGTLLLSALAQELSTRIGGGGDRGGTLNCSVVDRNKKGAKFYQSLGAKVLGEWSHMRLEGKDLDRLGETYQRVLGKN